MVYSALLPVMRTPRLPVVDWTDDPADLNGLVRFAERRNLVSARVPSHYKRSLSHYTLHTRHLSLPLLSYNHIVSLTLLWWRRLSWQWIFGWWQTLRICRVIADKRWLGCGRKVLHSWPHIVKDFVSRCFEAWNSFISKYQLLYHSKHPEFPLRKPNGCCCLSRKSYETRRYILWAKRTVFECYSRS